MEIQHLSEMDILKGEDLVYLACPYAGTPAEQALRWNQVTVAAGVLYEEGYIPISSITQNHSITMLYPRLSVKDNNFWYESDLQILRRCDAMLVLMLRGWKESSGIKLETRWAGERDIPVYHITLENLTKLHPESKERLNK